MTYDPFFHCATVECHQSKPGKTKHVMLPPGRRRHGCFLHSLAAYFVMNDKIAYDVEESNWFLPPVQGLHSGNKMSGFIKGMQIPGKPGHLTKYAQSPVCHRCQRLPASGQGHATLLRVPSRLSWPCTSPATN